MAGPAVDSWDVLDDLISKDGQKEQEKLIEPRRPVTAATSRKTTAADDWLGLLQQRPKSGSAETTPSYEPSSWRGGGNGPNASRRQNLRRQSTQQLHHQRGSRSAGLLFSDDDDDDDYDGGGVDEKNVLGDDGKKKADGGGGGRNVFDNLFADTPRYGNTGRSQTTGTAANDDAAAAANFATSSTTANVDPAVTSSYRRRDTSPAMMVTAAAKTTPTTEKMPSWLSGLIQQKDDIPQRNNTSPPPPTVSARETTGDVQKSGENETKVTEKNSSSVLSLLKGKDNIQFSILEIIQDLAEKKQNIQQATIRLIQDQLNSDLLIKALLVDNGSSALNHGELHEELEHLRSENNKYRLTIDHLIKKHELEIDAEKTKFELQKSMLLEKQNRFEERINELEEERKADIAERKEDEKRLKETYEDRLRMIHDSHLTDLKQTAEVQKIKMNHLEEVESTLRDSKSKRLTSEEMTAREISISAQENKLRDLQEEVEKQMAVLEGEKSALQMKIDEFQSRNQRERNELELASKELKRSMTAFEDGRKTWEREKKSEIQYIESRKQELEAVRSSVMEEQRKLAEERFEVASERYTLETMLKLDAGSGTDLIQAKLKVKQNLEELKKREEEMEKKLELVKEQENRLAEEKRKLQELDDETKLKSIRAEKMIKIAISKQEEGLKALESAKDIQNKFDKKGKDIHDRLLDIINREEKVVQEETKLTREKEVFNRQRNKLDLVLPQLSTDEMCFLNPKLNKYEAEKEVHYKKTNLYF